LALGKIIVGLVDVMKQPFPLVGTQYIGRAINRQVVGRDDEIDTSIEMKIDVGRDDIVFIADQQCHDQFHVTRIDRP
jgi:hypothetical protein